MKIFVSWSGDRSRTLATALRDWLPLVLHYVDPWLSNADLAAGERWADTVARELEATNYGVLCVTRDNLSAPWILFEAGSLAKSLQNSRVIPLLLDVEFSDLGGPLAQFQAKKVDRDGFREVIDAINEAAPQPVPPARAQQLFDALWPQLESQVATIPAPSAPAKPLRPHHEILEELVSSIRSLDTRLRSIEEVVATEPRTGRPRRVRFHAAMLHDLSHMMSDRPGDPVLVLLLAAQFKDAAPWLYELGLDVYRLARTGNVEQTKTAMRRFQRAIRFTMKGPFSAEELGIDTKNFRVIVGELDHVLEDLTHHMSELPLNGELEPSPE